MDQNHGLTPLEKCQFLEFFNILFYSLKRRFFVLEDHKTHFPAPYCLNKKIGKMANFNLDKNHGKMSIFRLCELLVFIAKKGLFSFYKIIKHICPPYILHKNKRLKMANFGQKPWTNPFGKISLFRVFQLLVFIN